MWLQYSKGAQTREVITNMQETEQKVFVSVAEALQLEAQGDLDRHLQYTYLANTSSPKYASLASFAAEVPILLGALDTSR